MPRKKALSGRRKNLFGICAGSVQSADTAALIRDWADHSDAMWMQCLKSLGLSSALHPLRIEPNTPVGSESSSKLFIR
jgi:hypothetical protein